MRVTAVVDEALKNVKAPAYYQTRGADNPDTYITFFEYNNRPELTTDDVETQTGHFVQVDVWSKGNFIDLVDDVRQAMIDAGFKKRDERDLYEDETKTFHRAMRFTQASTPK